MALRMIYNSPNIPKILLSDNADDGDDGDDDDEEPIFMYYYKQIMSYPNKIDSVSITALEEGCSVIDFIFFIWKRLR